jgi:predicted RNA binding protein YcfA (HicA-like mRNA interferase family)
MDSRLKHIKPREAKKFLELNGYVHVNTKGTHWTFVNKQTNRIVQVICNCKEIYPKNAKIMIEKSGISIKEWIKKR